jgi:hypothetical protein
MKVNLELDLTPEEMRRLFGLPDVAPVNDMLVDRLRDQMEKGLDGTLLRNMVQSMVKGGTQGIEAYQSLLMSMFRMGRRSDGDDAPGPPPAAGAGAPTPGGPQAGSGAPGGPSGAASGTPGTSGANAGDGNR